MKAKDIEKIEWLHKTMDGRHVLKQIAFPISNHFKTHPELIPDTLILELLQVLESITPLPQEQREGLRRPGLELTAKAHLMFLLGKECYDSEESDHIIAIETAMNDYAHDFALSRLPNQERVSDEKAFFPILRETITEDLFNEQDLYWMTPNGDLRLCIAWGECVDKMETCMYWYTKTPINQWLSQLPNRPTGKEEEIVKTINEMCIESLSPEVFEQWENVKLNLERTRKDLKS